jgi:hypothetical protein
MAVAPEHEVKLPIDTFPSSGVLLRVCVRLFERIWTGGSLESIAAMFAAE